MPKVKKSKGASERSGAGLSLADQILQGDALRSSGRVKNRSRAEEEQEYVDEKLSRKILQQARIQQEELQSELGLTPETKRQPATQLGPSTQDGDSDDEWPALGDDRGETGGDVDVDPEDEKAIEMFMSKNPPLRRTLADIIMEKITEKQTEVGTVMSEVSGHAVPQLDPRVVEVYRGVNKVVFPGANALPPQVLSKYRSGKLPKAFKIIPALSNWEQVLYLTDPETWTAAAMYQATRSEVTGCHAYAALRFRSLTPFVSERMAQRFYNLVLLPRVRDDIAEYKRLNFHLYSALKKALFKPGAWFKGERRRN
ncbi:hypothetical protein M9458_050435 [Cirrhinus mrigala]|uniref:Bystin n=1 Tax=Cirrhinus mrigala TaxID=683832 RepID=A0ABD0MWH2_CIRMR